MNATPKRKFVIDEVRRDFPVLRQKAYDKPLIYLDNAATTQKPQSVIDSVSKFYSEQNANIHRGVFCLSEQATRAYENTRLKIMRLIHAPSEREVVFVKGTTEGINLVSQSFGRKFVNPGDEVLITMMEHHSNIVPWQMLCEERGAVLRVIPITKSGELDVENWDDYLTEKTRILAMTHVSNALGTVNPIKEIIQKAHAKNIPVLIDGAQGIAHYKVDVQQLDCDFYVFSGHKVFGPTGVGVVYGKEKWLEQMLPYQGGGDMIKTVSVEKTVYNDLPYKFEAGTPNIAGVIGLGESLNYLDAFDWSEIEAYERELLDYANHSVREVEGLKMVGTAEHKAGVLSFTLGTAHSHDIGFILDREGVAIRTGHHCAMPAMQFLGLSGTARASFSFYNTKEEIDHFVLALNKVNRMFQ